MRGSAFFNRTVNIWNDLSIKADETINIHKYFALDVRLILLAPPYLHVGFAGISLNQLYAFLLLLHLSLTF